jgi:uncharacterized membrane protein HdeD (DUF308 family)
MFIRLQDYRQRFVGHDAGGVWWMLMTPGLCLILVGLAILIWPELLAYTIAMGLLFVGVTLIIWGWRIRRAAQGLRQQMTSSHRQDW